MNTDRSGWECGPYMQRHIESLYQLIDKLQQETIYQQALLDSLKAEKEKRSQAARMPTTEEKHQAMLDSLASSIADLSEEDRGHVMRRAQAWSAGMVYSTSNDDPAKRLAYEVSNLNGYGLGAFMQHLMKFGHESQQKMFDEMNRRYEE